jgi:NAD(P)H-hydrate repair Nnr-like enzyme with NAD(P)H-hydrate epimerase domain
MTDLRQKAIDAVLREAAVVVSPDDAAAIVDAVLGVVGTPRESIASMVSSSDERL